MSILPTIDNVIYNASPLFLDIWRAPNEDVGIRILMNASAPLSIFEQIHSVLTLHFYQFFEQSFTTPVLTVAKHILLSILTMLSGSPKNLFKMAYFSAFGLVLNGGLRYFYPKPSPKMLKIQSAAMLTIGAPMMYFYPIVTGLSLLMITALNFDAFDRQHGKPAALLQRRPFIQYFLTLIAPLLYHVYKQIKK